ncbi:MAG: SoxR reducing system RseC family protein [Alphaproteobacteria bacterium]|nr:SoxR reducing system RseC family protein [Alphaproteobacteria bacterium]
METSLQQGTITAIRGQEVTVAINCKSSCLHCQIKNNCTIADSRLKDITLHAPETSHLHIGQKVTLAMDDRLGWLAVFFGYILPLIIVLTVLLATLAATSSDTMAAVLSLGALLPYYILLAVFRKKISRHFNFRIISE